MHFKCHGRKPVGIYYMLDTLRDGDGNKIDSTQVGNLTFDVETDVDAFNVVPALVYVTPWQVLGARYGLLVAQPFGNTSVQASLEEVSNPEFALEIDEDGFGLGDTYVRSLWLGWDFGRGDLAASYGVYAPSGKYEDGAADNISLGMWTHEFMLAGALYLDRQRGTRPGRSWGGSYCCGNNIPRPSRSFCQRALGRGGKFNKVAPDGQVNGKRAIWTSELH